MRTIVHIIDNLGLGGAQAMLFEIHYAIKKYYSEEYKQVVISNENRRVDKKFVSSYNISYLSVRNPKEIKKKVLSCNEPIIFYHKLASSRPETIRSIKKKRNIPIIVINHTLFQTQSWNIDGICDVMVSVSDHMKRKSESWYPNIKKHKVIHNAVNYKKYKKIEAIIRGEKEVLLTGRINRICMWKHSNKWIEWCSSVNLPIRMVHEYMGGGPMANQAAISVKKSKNRRNKVKMLGSIDNFNQKVSILKSWDLFLYETNKNEGISVAILEALACGVPVVCSNHYGNKEIIEEGVNGYIFKNKEEARKILKKLCTDKKKLFNLKESTKNHFREKLDGKFMIGKYIKLVNKICK